MLLTKPGGGGELMSSALVRETDTERVHELMGSASVQVLLRYMHLHTERETARERERGRERERER